jgi:hypothetical protein
VIADCSYNIDPFLESLGWGVRNVQGRGEHDKDVIHEDAIRVGGKTLAPDYVFRVGRARKFFLEAKKPAVSLKGDVGPAYQLRRYSWSVKLPLHQKLAAAIPADKQLYQRQTWRELAERSRPPTGRLTCWCLLNSKQVRVVWLDGGGNRGRESTTKRKVNRM